MASVLDQNSKALTGEQILEMPDDGIDRVIIRGDLRERPTTRRNPTHSAIESNIAYLLKAWQKQTATPGRVHSGDAWFRLSRDPETTVGIDVAFASAEQAAAFTRKMPFHEGAPVLAVEIRSPSDRQENVVEKVSLYLEAGSVVWLVDPDFRAVSVHRPGRLVETFNESQELSGEPELPGFRVAVAEIFE